MTKILPDKIDNIDHKRHYSEKILNNLFTERSQIDGSKIILKFNDQKFTSSDINESSNKLARFLLKNNVKIEERVGLVLDRSPDLVIAMLGIMKAGAAYVPLDP